MTRRTRQDLVTARIAQLSASRLFREHGIDALAVADERMKAALDAGEADEIEVWKAIRYELESTIKNARC